MRTKGAASLKHGSFRVQNVVGPRMRGQSYGLRKASEPRWVSFLSLPENHSFSRWCLSISVPSIPDPRLLKGWLPGKRALRFPLGFHIPFSDLDLL